MLGMTVVVVAREGGGRQALRDGALSRCRVVTSRAMAKWHTLRGVMSRGAKVVGGAVLFTSVR